MENTQDDMLKLENQVCFPLYVASRMIIRAYQPLLDELGITYPQYLVLLALWEKGEQTVKEIASSLYLNTNTITPLLKRMEKMDIIVRTRSKQDERKVMITLTETGSAMKEKAYCIPEGILKATGMSVEEINRIKDTLHVLIKQMEAVEDAAQ